MIERYPTEMLQKQQLDKLVSIRDAEMMIRYWRNDLYNDYDDSILDRIRRELDIKALEHHRLHNPKWYKRIIEARCKTT